MGYYNFDEELENIDKMLSEYKKDLEDLRNENKKQNAKLDELLKRATLLAQKQGINLPTEEPSEKKEESLESDINLELNSAFPKGERQKELEALNLTATDMFVSAAIGGIATLVDFFLVKIPKDAIYLGQYTQEASPLTSWLREFGTDDNGKASSWVKGLEEAFKVPYDKSANTPDFSVPGFSPKTHRLMSLGHDPLFGLVAAFIDILNGSCTTIGKDGVLRVEKLAEGIPFSEAFGIPITWFGHLLSDVTTKMGLPIPGWSALQVLQFGSFGEKERTLADLSRYMYMEGYDLRHFLTMSVVPAVINVISRLYFYFLCRKESDSPLISDREYVKIKNDVRLRKILFAATAVATAGNVAKLAAYQGNPTAINIPLWLSMLKESVSMAKVALRDTKHYEKAMENRAAIDDNWDYLLKLYPELSKQA